MTTRLEKLFNALAESVAELSDEALLHEARDAGVDIDGEAAIAKQVIQRAIDRFRAEERRREAEKSRRGIEVLKEKSEQQGASVCTISGKPPDPDYARSGGAPQDVKANGQHKDYYILCEEERAKGFVRPVRDRYRHVGKKPKYPLRPLTEEEFAQHGRFGYTAYEEYPESERPMVGRFWKQADLDRKPCNTTTTMSRPLAETYARDPKFYGSTFCCGCGTHFPVEEFVWDDGSVLGS